MSKSFQNIYSLLLFYTWMKKIPLSDPVVLGYQENLGFYVNFCFNQYQESGFGVGGYNVTAIATGLQELSQLQKEISGLFGSTWNTEKM